MKRLFKAVAVWSALLLVFSCTTARQIRYLHDMAYDTDYLAAAAPEIIIQPDDCLGITVTSSTPELAAPFNLYSDGTSGVRYVVDKKGDIDFPVLGTIHVGGSTLSQIKSGIAEGIRDNGFMKDPVVNVSLENFSVTIIGSAGNRVIPVTDNSINLLQVIAMTGNLTNKSKFTDVMVVRTEDGIRRAHSVNLQSKDLFESPVFYLRQNDVVYIKPQGTTMSASGQTAMTFVNAGLSLATIITNIILWSNR